MSDPQTDGLIPAAARPNAAPPPSLRPLSHDAASTLLGILVAAAVIAFAVWLAYPKMSAVVQKHRVFFVDPDDYLRVHRAKEIASGEARRISFMPEIDVPIGCEMHWTAPMDYVLAGLCGTCKKWVSHPDGFGYVAAFVPILLGAGYLLCMMAGMRRGFGWGAGILAGLMIVLSPGYHRVFQLGHPDHHALIELLSLIAIVLWIPRARTDGTPGEPRLSAAILSGLAMGLAIWTASLTMLVWFAILIGVSVACLRGPDSLRAKYITCRFAWSCCVGGLVLVGWFFENWPAFSSVTIDKISLVHLAAVGLAFLAPQRTTPLPRPRSGKEIARGVETGKSQHQTTRLILLLFGMAAFAVWLGAMRSSVFEYVNKPEVHRWHEQIQELQPLLVRTGEAISLFRVHAYMAYLPYALPLMLVFFLFSKRVSTPIKCICGLLAPTFTIAALLQTRWIEQVNLAAVPVMIIGAIEFVRFFTSRIGFRSTAVPVMCATVLLTAIMYPTCYRLVRARLAVKHGAMMPVDQNDQRTDFVGLRLREYDDQHPQPNAKRRAILAAEGDGPMLLYDTGLPVVAVPYHRALDGIIRAGEFYSETNPYVARKMLDEWGVRYVVIPWRAHEQLMNLEYIAFGELRSYDKPDLTIDDQGHISQGLHYRPRVARTMAYRLFMERDEVIPGVERIAEIMEGAPTEDGWSGLLYVVHRRPTSAPATSNPVPD